MDLTSTFAPIAKYTDQDDGSLMVYGKATDGGLDLDDQRCDPTWLSTAMPEWFRSAGNIRAQHRADSAVGKATEHTFDADGHYITARIVDREAIAKTKAGVFTGFSIGIRRPKIVKSPMAPNGLINGGQITEVSLCDRPANPACTLMLCKSASEGWEGRQSDFDSERGLVKCEDLNFYPENEIRIKTVAEPITPEPVTPELVTTEAQAQKAADELLELAKGAADEVRIQVDAQLTPEQLAEFTAKFGPEAGDGVAEANKALGQSEAGDISGADTAIASIAQLIISEAKDLAKMPSQDCDIHLLMSAVDALRCFARREQMEQAGTDPDNVIRLAADAEALKAKYSAEQLRTMLKEGKAMKNPQGEPSYPIGDVADLQNAIHAVGRGSGSHDAIRAYIKKRAAALGKSDMIPDNWKTASATTTKAEDMDSKTVTSNPADVDVAADGPDAEVVEAGKADDAPETTKVDDAPEGTKSTDAEEAPITEPEPVSEATKAEAPSPEFLAKAFSDALGEDDSLLVKAFSDALSESESPLTKAFNAALDKEDSPLRKMFEGIVEASTKSAAKALGDELGARLEKVEAMATPGGPALRRTESERNQARKNDLVLEAARYKAMATHTEDQDLRKGYAIKAAQLEAEIKTLA